MAKVKLFIASVLAPYVGGSTELSVEANDLSELLNRLVKDYGENLRSRLLDETGEPRRFVNIFVNDRDFRFTGRLETKLNDEDEVYILPAVSGGALPKSPEIGSQPCNNCEPDDLET